MSQTLIDLIDHLKSQRSPSFPSLRKESTSSFSTLQEMDEFRLSLQESKSTHSSTRGWSKQDDSTFQKLVDTYGSDFTVIQTHFPGHSRKQIKKRFDKLESRRERRRAVLEQLRREREKKWIFEEDILEVAGGQQPAITQTNNPKQNPTNL